MTESPTSTRLIVKNIPPYVTDKRFMQFFSEIGPVTDAVIRRNERGRSRKFGFVGFKTADLAAKAKDALNNTYFDTCKISIDFAKPIGDESLEDTYARRKRHVVNPVESKQEPEKEGKVEDDPEYQEYLHAALERQNRSSWNDFPEEINAREPQKVEENESEDTDSGDEAQNDSDEKQEEENDASEGTNRIYITNIPYSTTQDELREAFSQFGEIEDVSVPIKTITKTPAGYAFITFADRTAFEAAIKTPVVFQGRHLKLHLAKPPPNPKPSQLPDDDETFKEKKERLRRINKPDSWNALFLNPDTVASAIAHRLGLTKSEILNPQADGAATRLALAESQLVKETKEMFETAGINTAAFDNMAGAKLSHTLIIAKNLKYETEEEELRALFAAHGSLVRFILAPTHAVALVEYAKPDDAKKAYQSLMFRKVRDTPLMLQWAPEAASGSVSEEVQALRNEKRVSKPVQELKTTTLILKNVPFQATKAEIHEVCKTFGRIKAVRMPKKADGSGHRGFAFLDFNTRQEATSAYENLRDVHLYGRHLIVQPAAEGRNVESLSEKKEESLETPKSKVSH